MKHVNISKNALLFALLFPLIFISQFAISKAPTIDQKDDSKNFGSADNILFWTPEQQVSGYRNSDKIFPTRKILAGDYVRDLPKSDIKLDDFTFRSNEQSLTIDEYFENNNMAGMIILKDGKVVYEKYGLGNDKHSLWVSFSVAKSVTSLLIGAAIKDGYIKSIDDKVTDYLPLLKNSAYDDSTIKNVMQMSSGVQWDEDYADPKSDINSATWETLELNEYLRNKTRMAKPGEVFNYNTAETNLVGTILRSAIGNNLSTYLSEKIWKPFGMEADANWNLTEIGGGEFGGCCINATLRDYARIGLFAMEKGKLKDGSNVLPEQWMKDSTAPSKGYPGYGYMWWLTNSSAYKAVGIFGQGIYIDPKEDIIIAYHSAREEASNKSFWKTQDEFYEALIKELRK